MTYTIEGTLQVQEKPAKYLNKFVENNVTEFMKNGVLMTKRSFFYTPSKRIAHFMNKRGHELIWNDNLEDALAMCQEGEKKIDEKKILTPRMGWPEYLTNTFGDTDDYRALEGELKIWSETRIPTPWLYFFAPGKLVEKFTCKNGEFFVPRGQEVEGKRRTLGLILETSFLTLYLRTQNTKESCMTRTYQRF